MTLVVAAAGCGDSSADKAGSRTTKVTQPLTNTKPTAPPTTTRDQLKEQILADYKKAWDAYHDAINIPDPAFPSLEQTHTGVGLRTVRSGLVKILSKGQVGRDGPHSRSFDRAVVAMILEGRASVNDCRVDDGLLVDKTTGAAEDASVTTHTVRSDLLLESGTWKLERVSYTQEWQGVAGCAIVH